MNNLLSNIAPKKYLYCYSLYLGALNIGIGMCVVSVICCICTALQVSNMRYCQDCPSDTARNAYGFSITAVLFSIKTLVASIWFLWGGVKQAKSSVALGYLVIYTMWMVLTVCLLIVLLILYSSVVSFISWLLALIGAILVIKPWGSPISSSGRYKSIRLRSLLERIAIFNVRVVFLYSWLILVGYWIHLKHRNSQVTSN